MNPTLRGEIREIIKRVIEEKFSLKEFDEKIEITVPPPKKGDYASNIAFILCKKIHGNPPELSSIIKEEIERRERKIFKKVAVEGGFLNFFLDDNYLKELLIKLVESGFLPRVNVGKGKRVLLEFVSANPTGPLHIGHGRNAATGDSIGRILSYSGFEVEREFYINDAGNQIKELGNSVIYMKRKKRGENPDDKLLQYPGEYVEKLAEEMGEIDEKDPLSVGISAGERILRWIKEDLTTFRVEMDNFVSEREKVRKDDLIKEIVDRLRELKLIDFSDGALIFKAEELGDDKSRVLIKSDGEPTYFATDIIYHINKFKRNYDLLINVWGADHHGYLPRLKAALRALGHDVEKLKVVFIQMVNLLKNGKPVQMSKRKGEFITLRELINEVGESEEEGVDCLRFTYLTRRSDSHLDLDVDFIKSQDKNNPVYYTQYAYARICSIFREAEKRNFLNEDFLLMAKEHFTEFNFEDEEERNLVVTSFRFPEVIEDCAIFLEPHRLTYYLMELAKIFHGYYNRHRVLAEDVKIRWWRLCLVEHLRRIFKTGLQLLGVKPKEKM